MSKFPKALKSAREKADLSQAELANKCGVAPSTVAGWESGTHGIRMNRIPTIAKILSTTVEKLVAA